MPWSALALATFIVASSAVSIGVVLLLGVLGGQWALRRQIIEARDAAELANTRINREIKSRAGQKGVEARQEAKTVVQEAKDRLAAEASSPATPAKPSTISMINGGR